jgi:hypothetical protein
MTLRLPSLRISALLSLLALFVIAGCSDLGAPLILRPHAELSESLLDFGTIAITDSATRSITLSNTGNADLNGDANVSCEGFRIVSGGGAYRIATGGSHTIVVQFNPPGVGLFACELSLGGDVPVVPLSGSGAQQPAGAACTVSTSVLDFGALSSGGSKLLLFKVYSTGTAPVNLDVIAGCSVFSIVGGGGQRALAPGDSLAVTVNFAPTSGGAFECTVATGAGCPSVTLRGSATTVSFRADLLPILIARQCRDCHGYSTASSIVNVNSFVYGAPLIKPFDPNGSVLYAKIANLRTYGGAMPQGTSGLSAAERKKWFDWINEGALDN